MAGTAERMRDNTRLEVKPVGLKKKTRTRFRVFRARLGFKNSIIYRLG